MLERIGVAALLVVAGLATFGTGGSVAATGPTRCATPAATVTGGRELHAPTTRGEVWALPLNPTPPKVGDSLKIVWRVTGKGPLHVRFRDPQGRTHPLVFGPQRHSSSTFRHPGEEWGTGFAFDTPGCWTIRVRRSGADSTVGIRVV